MNDRSKVLLIMLIVTVAIVVYAAVPQYITDGNFMLRKLNLGNLSPDTLLYSIRQASSDTTKAKPQPDEMPGVDRTGYVGGVDTTRHVVLFFGDSMTSGLSLRLDDYCHENGHSLYCVTWNSSSTKKYAESNIIDTYIRLYHPTYIIICLGSNELFVHDVAGREQYVRGVVNKLGCRPFVWISPPNWKPDTGMNALIRKCVGRGRYFDSTHLTLERGSDHIHPTAKGAAKWMDLIAAWIADPRQNDHPILMNKPRRPYYSRYYDIYGTDFTGFSTGDSPERHRHYNY